MPTRQCERRRWLPLRIGHRVTSPGGTRPQAEPDVALVAGGAAGRQRFGRVTDPVPGAPGSEPGGRGRYAVRDDETGAIFGFGFADIVTEGLRAVRPGERVRFLTDPAAPGRAAYVIRLEAPDAEDYYQ